MSRNLPIVFLGVSRLVDIQGKNWLGKSIIGLMFSGGKLVVWPHTASRAGLLNYTGHSRNLFNPFKAPPSRVKVKKAHSP